MRDLFVTFAFIIALIGLYRFRAPILATLRRFDERNIARRRQEMQDRKDAKAHFRHTLQLAGEQVEEILTVETADERTGTPVTHYVFEGETFLSRDEAEAARNEKVVAKARDFYMELPAALAHRGKGKLN